MRMDQMDKARETINAIDREMAMLFQRRMEAVRDIAAYKQERGLAIFDAGREKTVLEKNAALYPDDETRALYVSFLQNVMDISKHYQHHLMEEKHIAYSRVVAEGDETKETDRIC